MNKKILVLFLLVILSFGCVEENNSSSMPRINKFTVSDIYIDNLKDELVINTTYGVNLYYTGGGLHFFYNELKINDTINVELGRAWDEPNKFYITKWRDY